jgi:hypothetical protein
VREARQPLQLQELSSTSAIASSAGCDAQIIERRESAGQSKASCLATIKPKDPLSSLSIYIHLSFVKKYTSFLYTSLSLSLSLSLSVTAISLTHTHSLSLYIHTHTHMCMN